MISKVVRDRRTRRVSAFASEIMGDITTLFGEGEEGEIPIFENQMPTEYISDLHEFQNENEMAGMTSEIVMVGKEEEDEEDEIPGYETPQHTELLMGQLPPFSETLMTGTPMEFSVAAAVVSTPDGRCERVEIAPGASSTEAGCSLAAAFGLAAGSFILRDGTGCVVPLSAASLGGDFSLEVPSLETDEATAVGGATGSAATLKFLQEPPHSAAVWLHTKLTKKGEIAGSCARHTFSPAPQVAISLPDDDGERESKRADNRAALLEQATVTLVDAAGVDAVDKHGQAVLHAGTPVIRTDPATDECSITWPEMAVLDTSRTVHGMAAKDLKVSAEECGGDRGAVGWFSLKISVPGCDDLWLKSSATGKRAKIIVKNERNAALGWSDKGVGPYADHSRCMPSHIDADGKRLCGHGGCGAGGTSGCNRFAVQIKAEPRY